MLFFWQMVHDRFKEKRKLAEIAPRAVGAARVDFPSSYVLGYDLSPRSGAGPSRLVSGSSGGKNSN